MKSLGLLGLVFDTGLTVTALMGHLGCLASHYSVPVVYYFIINDEQRAGWASSLDIILLTTTSTPMAEQRIIGKATTDRQVN